MILRDEYGNSLVLGESDRITLKDALMGNAFIGGMRVNLSGGTRDAVVRAMKDFLLTRHCRKGSSMYSALSRTNFTSLIVKPQYERLMYHNGKIKYVAGQEYSYEISLLKKSIIENK